VLGAWTISSWLPVLVWGVTDCPAPAVSFTAGVAPGEPPAGTTNTWNAGPDAGAGVHLYAQPMFHCPLLTVNGVLVQAPLDCLGPSNTETVPAGAAVEVGGAPPVAVVVVELDPAKVVVVAGTVDPEEPVPAGVLVPPAGAAAGGNL
jgi:hypothetical protein